MEQMFAGSAAPARRRGPRILPFAGIENFRDLGGYQAADGRQVKYGALYRSASLYRMTAADRALFETLHISTILDYRNATEADEEPSPAFSGVAQERFPAICDDDFCEEKYLTRQYRERLKPNVLAEYYRALAKNGAAYARLLELCLASEGGAVLQHCAAGKDRTGVGTAVLYMALGVPREIILEDYLVSNRLLLGYMRRQLAQVLPHYTQPELRCFTDTLLAKEEYLKAFFAAVDARYPTTQAFLEKHLGLAPGRVQRLRNKYLEG